MNEPAPHPYDPREAIARIDGDRELFDELLDMFLADAQGYLDDIDVALTGQDLPALKRAAHTLKGMLATFSAHPARERALALELAARECDGMACRAERTRLGEEMDRLLAAMRADRAGGG